MTYFNLHNFTWSKFATAWLIHVIVCIRQNRSYNTCIYARENPYCWIYSVFNTNHKTEFEKVIRLSSIRVQLSFVLLVTTKVRLNGNRKNNTKPVNRIMKNETRATCIFSNDLIANETTLKFFVSIFCIIGTVDLMQMIAYWCHVHILNTTNGK